LAASTPEEATKAYVPQLDIDANELALVYRARGMPADEAERRADDVLHRRPVAATPANLPAESAEVVGTGINAGVSSFLSFGFGALVPVLPFIFGLTGVTALIVASLLTGMALLATGAVVAILSGGPPLWRALRQLAIGAGAAAVTYLLGLAFATTIS
jgi:vacuolar iron transporter family protein